MGKWSDGVTALRRTEGDGERGTAVKKCDETAAVRAAAGNAAADSGPGLGQMGWGGGNGGVGERKWGGCRVTADPDHSTGGPPPARGVLSPGVPPVPRWAVGQSTGSSAMGQGML